MLTLDHIRIIDLLAANETTWHDLGDAMGIHRVSAAQLARDLSEGKPMQDRRALRIARGLSELLGRPVLISELIEEDTKRKAPARKLETTGRGKATSHRRRK